MIISYQGDICISGAEALVNPVNCVGACGKGLAAQFKAEFPDNYSKYRKECDAGRMTPGRVFVADATSKRKRYVWIINFPTKRHWRDRSLLADVDAGLDHLAEVIGILDLKSIAVPMLGCGLGGLDWRQRVRPLVVAKLGETAADIHLFENNGGIGGTDS